MRIWGGFSPSLHHSRGMMVVPSQGSGGHREGAAVLLFLDCITQLPDGKPPSPGAIKWIKKGEKKKPKKERS